MHKLTRQKFMAFVSHIALLNGVDSAAHEFNVAPQIEQTAENRIRESSEFLTMINVHGVNNAKGQVLGLDSGSIAGRTDTSNGTRLNPADPSLSGEKISYECEDTDYNWSRSYKKIDAWRHLPNFETRLRDAILNQQALDRMMIGFNGTFVAANTDREANPLLQDVNIGWLEKIRANAPGQVIDDGDLTVLSDGTNDAGRSAIYVKPGVALFDEGADNATTAQADYSSLDALVRDAKTLIHERYRNSTDLVVIVGHDLVDDKYFNIAQQAGGTATEVEATDRLLSSSKQLGGLKAYGVSFFPSNALLITTMDNLSIYYHEGTRRRRMVDEPEYKRIANYESVSEAYVVEEYVLTALVENIVIGEAPARTQA